MVEPGNVLLSPEIQPTIIGAKAFHCPVRNGKEWDRLAMVTRQSSKFFANETKRVAIAWDSRVLTDNLSKVIKLHGYRIKLHEQLVLVSSTPHSAYTPNLSTSWSRTTL